ncbi:transmembrane protein 248 isoform X1 [Salmo salar]|uniref:Transmembrane protein 248 isoform X1 n=1 Tax=Salmo salar TaxID=8030 RepID=A0A1S3PFM2_SALSA|nr:transmembrane protein 248 isoform X1 [Salmo salar]
MIPQARCVMGSWQPVANLRDYVSQHPPGVTFFLCVLTLALTFLSLGSYTHTHRLPNPDTQDWNQFLSSLANLQLCARANGTAMETVSSPPFAKEEVCGTVLLNSTQSPPSITQLSLWVPLAVMDSSDIQSLSDLCLHGTLLASQLGLTGNEAVNVTLMFSSPSVGGNSHACLSVSAPTHILPPALLPPMCPANEGTSSPVRAIAMEISSQKPSASQSCYSLQYTPDPTLTAMLTQEELGLASRHLIQVSVCLLGVCVLLCFSASLTHSHVRRYHSNGLELQREPLIDS